MKDSELKFIGRHLPYLWRFMNKIGFEPDASDSIDETALMYLAEDGDKPFYGQAATMLIRNGWDLEAQDIYGKTPLHYAVYSYNFNFARSLLQYKMSEKNLIKALYQSFKYYRKNDAMCDLFILTLIEKTSGISPEKSPDALLYALGGRALPYLIPLVAAGFSYTQEKYDCYLFEDDEGEESIYRQFMNQKDRFVFENHNDYPIYIENGIIRARPELYHKTWPSLPRGIKKQFNKVQPTLHMLNYIVSKIAK